MLNSTGNKYMVLWHLLWFKVITWLLCIPQTSWKQDTTTAVKPELHIEVEEEKVSKHLLAFIVLYVDISQLECGYTTDIQNVRPSEGGRIRAPQKRSSVYFVLELINLKAFICRGAAFSHLEHACQGDQAEVTDEQGHDLWYVLTWLCFTSGIIVHEAYWLNAHFMYIPKGNISLLIILGVVFSQTWLSSQAEPLEKNISKKRRAGEKSSILSLTPDSVGAPQSDPV